ncbi:MAG: hypothetical protein KDD69_06750 [Bdellovibrionales bacterium]|nr:hypothetical protein [Bdellovibrionales bacterium]
MKLAISPVTEVYREACTRLVVCCQRHASALLLLLGVTLLLGGMVELSVAQGGGPTGSFSEAAYEDDLVRNSVGNIFKLIEGAFGALIMVVAGLGAIVAAAMGAYRAALGMLVVAVGAFILRALVSLFFGADYVDFEAT